ncbi:hypothetical protein EJ110_NYTH10016 [Nymphaea thermarum]|nr:hypothetical protein EJ110_NYTH10016 [Nymphaea thermarum]
MSSASILFAMDEMRKKSKEEGLLDWFGPGVTLGAVVYSAYRASWSQMFYQRHMYLTKEMLKENPNICNYMLPSLDVCQAMMIAQVPRLGKKATVEAAGYQVINLPGLSPSVQQVRLYQQGCSSGGAALCIAKDIA